MRTEGHSLEAFQLPATVAASEDGFTQELRRLRARLESEGAFTPDPRTTAFAQLRIFCFFACGTLLAIGGFPVAALLAFSGASIDLVWWIHDAGHDAIFAQKSTTAPWINSLGIFFLGMPQTGYHFVTHRHHHGATNSLDHDPALQTGPVIWDPRMAGRSSPLLARMQAIIWFVGVLPTAYLWLTLGSARVSYEKREFGVLGFLALRWIVVICTLVVFPHAPFTALLIIAPPFVAGTVLAYFASLNHFHRPILGPTERLSHKRAVLAVTQNLSGTGPFLHWLSGGLDHHIEHHLFPDLPSRALSAIAPRVRAICGKYGVPYSECSIWEATGLVWRRLNDPELTGSAASDTFSSRAAFVAVRGSAPFLPLLVAASAWRGGIWVWAMPFYFFIGTFLIGWISRSRFDGESPKLPEFFEKVLTGTFPRVAYAVSAIGATVAIAYALHIRHLGALECAGLTLSWGLVLGSVGGLTAHEWIHQRSRFGRAIGTFLYSLSFYGHFTCSHLRGHHLQVGQLDDWNTARRNEGFYAFLKRATWDGWNGAKRIDANFTLRITVLTGTVFLLALNWTGMNGVAVFGLGAFLSVVLMEMVNYVSHYGLIRRENRIELAHAWESAHSVTNWLILDAGKHADHHLHPSRSHQDLRVHHRSPQLPYGLPAMALLSLVPPLFLRKMNQRLDGWAKIAE